jgi:hypothetical protein
MAKRKSTEITKFSVGGAPIFGNPQGVTGKGQKGAGGWGVGNKKSKPAGGQNPSQNPFIIPKPAGLNVTSQTFPSYYYVEWNITSWRYACEQVMRMGWAISYAALTTWAFTSSPFIQSLFTKLGRALDKVPFFITDEKGNKLEDWSLELCGKPWHLQLRQEILFSYMWGFSGINFDPVAGKVYKYPQQEIDPINRLLKQQTYSFYDGTAFEDNQNLLFVQPSTNYESFLGWMQPITRKFVQMNLSDNNWVAAGTRLAFPIMTVGYPQDDNSVDSITGNETNNYKLEAINIARNISPTEAQVYPYTLNEKNEPIKSALIEFESPHTSSQQHLVFKDFDAVSKGEIEQMVFGRAMTQATSKGGNRALGEVEERALDDTIEGLLPFIKAILNTDYIKKIAKFYTNFPEGIQFDYDNTKQLTIADITALSSMLVANGYKFTDQFLENSAGLAKGDFEAAPVAQEQNPKIEPELQMANQKKKFF